VGAFKVERPYCSQPSGGVNPVARSIWPGAQALADLFRDAMRTVVRVQSAKRLAALGAAAPDMPDIPRRQPQPDAPSSVA
jgi:hypothetical protein